MSINDEFQKERDSIKTASTKVKLQYFWDYYKWYVIGGVLAIAILISIISTVASNKQPALYLAMINTLASDDVSQYAQEVADVLDVDTSKHSINFDSSMFFDPESFDESTLNASQKMMVYMAAGDLDLMITDVAVFDYYAYNDVLHDLRNILSEEQIARYEPYFYYVDRSILKEKKAAEENMDLYFMPAYPENPSDPTSMSDPIPVGIFVEDQSRLTDHFLFHKGKVALGIIANTKHLDSALGYLDFIFAE